jgi:hypothetical protein
MRHARRRAGRSYFHRKLCATTITGLAMRTSHLCEAFQYLCLHVAHVVPQEEAIDRSRVRVSKRRLV